MGRLAILAGQGDLPRLIASEQSDAVLVRFAGVPVAAPDGPVLDASFERFGRLFDDLRAAGVSRVVLAGALSRPALDPARFDARTAAIMPGIFAAMAGGDDGLLRAVIAVFEAEGFAVLAAHDLVAGLTAPAGRLAGPMPSATDRDDAARAQTILQALGPLDIGQGAVVAAGQCLGIETAQGTDAMLRFVAHTPAGLRQGARGVLVKAPKPGQDLRVDMPAIGPATVAACARAGLSGIVLAAGRVLILARAETLDAANASGLFIMAQDL